MALLYALPASLARVWCIFRIVSTTLIIPFSTIQTSLLLLTALLLSRESIRFLQLQWKRCNSWVTLPSIADLLFYTLVAAVTWLYHYSYTGVANPLNTLWIALENSSNGLSISMCIQQYICFLQRDITAHRYFNANAVWVMYIIYTHLNPCSYMMSWAYNQDSSLLISVRSKVMQTFACLTSSIFQNNFADTSYLYCFAAIQMLYSISRKEEITRLIAIDEVETDEGRPMQRSSTHWKDVIPNVISNADDKKIIFSTPNGDGGIQGFRGVPELYQDEDEDVANEFWVLYNDGNFKAVDPQDLKTSNLATPVLY